MFVNDIEVRVRDVQQGFNTVEVYAAGMVLTRGQKIPIVTDYINFLILCDGISIQCLENKSIGELSFFILSFFLRLALFTFGLFIFDFVSVTLCVIAFF